MSTPPIDSVTGGSHGVVAGYAQMSALAAAYATESESFVALARLGPAVMLDPDLMESSVLSPATFQRAEQAVLGATTGADGLVPRALGLAADGLLISATVDAFRASDAVAAAAIEALDHALGSLLVTPIPGVAPPGAVVPLALGLAGASLWARLSPDQRDAAAARLEELLGDVVLHHPELVEHLTNAGGGLVDGLVPGNVGWLNSGDGPIGSATTGDAARLLAHLFGNRADVEVTRLGSSGAEAGATTVRELMERLAAANALDADDPSMRGAIRVETVVVDGERRHIVYLPGTDDMSPVPEGGRSARDMLTNYQVLGGLDSSYGEGITQAMRDAGLGGQQVMLVGHSQGGMEAAALAADPQFRQEFTVRHVVTAGSPTAQVAQLPDDVHALHLENRGDAVPLLDGARNPDQPGRVTVVFDEGTRDIAGNHSMAHYVSGGGAVDESADGSLQDLIERMRADGFLGGDVESTTTYLVQRP